jgi:hypothetical protein
MTIEYSKMITALVKPGAVIKDSLTSEGVDLWHMVTREDQMIGVRI